MSGMNNFHITIFTEMPYGFDLSFKTWYNNDYDYYISFPDKLKSKNWNHITIPISDIISNGMNISQLNGIAISGGSTATEATTIYITDMYFK